MVYNLCMANSIMRFFPEILDSEYMQSTVYDQLDQEWYWTTVWSASFYTRLARAGFITICAVHPNLGQVLLPQMHKESAMLHWENRHISRTLSRFVFSNSFKQMGAKLRITRNIDCVLERLNEAWGDESWLTTGYCSIMKEIQIKKPDFNFHLFGVELWVDGFSKPVSGELGYVIGSTYTSLSGFMDWDRKRWNNLGKIQLQTLALILEQSGFSFWNLGQSQMQYKLDMGARVTKRKDFLEQWLSAINKAPSPAFKNVPEQFFDCYTLLKESFSK